MKNIRYYVFWFIDKIKKDRIKKEYDEICSVQSRASCAKWQKEKIDRLLKKATENCKFYKDYGKYSEISQCPVIDKSVIKDNYDSFISKKYDRNSLHKMSTSGSTGTPFEILQNPKKRHRVMAELIYFNEIIGQNLGDKFIFYRVWTDKNKKSFLGKLKQNLMPIDILHLDENNLKYITDILLKDKKLKSTLGYASTYDAIYKYLKMYNISGNFSVKAMVSSSEVLSDETRDGLEKIIGCRVIDRYSNQECGVIAQSTMTEREFIINGASYYVEILKLNSDEPAEVGEVGRIVVTDLFNYAMPLIRYDTGDLATVHTKTEDGIYSLSSIQGRRVDIIYDTKGNPLTPHTWSVYMWKYDKLKQYQFIQEGKNDYLLKVNGAKGIYSEAEFDETLRSILGEDANIKIEYVDQLPVLASGKFKKTVCNYKPQN